MKKAYWPLLLTVGALSLLKIATAEYSQSQDWPFTGQNLMNTRFAASETLLSPSNVSGLGVKWIFTTQDDVAATPSVSVASHALYVPDWAGYLYRINTDSGKKVWAHTMSDYGLPAGIISRTTPAISGTTIIVAASAYLSEHQNLGAWLLAVDAATGNLRWKIQPDSNPDVLLTASPVIYRGIVYIGLSSTEENLLSPTFRGSVQAYSLVTGALLWQTYTVPEGYSGGPIWSNSPVVDTKRGSLYVTTGNNYTVPPSVLECEQDNHSDPSQILACQAPDNYFDSVLAMDLSTGRIKWGKRMIADDAWIGVCALIPQECPMPGDDYDFGAGPNLFTTNVNGLPADILGAGQKSGVYWALNPDNGNVAWVRQVGPGGKVGGIQGGTATDGTQVYVPISDFPHTTYTLKPSGKRWSGGSWAGLDAATGSLNWQVIDPGTSTVHPGEPALSMGPVTVANGVVYAPSMSGLVYALDAHSGNVLWSYDTGASVNGGAAVVNGTVYWGSGYGHFPHNAPVGTSNNKLFAFSLQE